MGMKRTPGTVVVFTTVPNRAQAAKMGRTLVKNRVAACATVVPGLRSFYRWEGKMVEGREVLLMLKTTDKQYPALEKTVRAVHPYDVPEIIAIPMCNGFPPYIEWVVNEVSN
ncbi:MAG TPA: divalent-cation tolerance protein CutA [Nitrospira sp.]|nr:divalent-cation tolerance protein CutA [Nitrospira sp.]